MSYYTRQVQTTTKRARSRPKPQAAKQWVTAPLTHAQKAELSILARSAYSIAAETSLTDLPADAWRHKQTQIACGNPSLRECSQRDYRPIKAHFLTFLGKRDEAAKLWQKTGRVKGSQEIHDTHENRETARVLLARIVAESAGKITDAYLASIVADQHPGRALEDLSASALQHLVYTLTARLKPKKE